MNNRIKSEGNLQYKALAAKEEMDTLEIQAVELENKLLVYPEYKEFLKLKKKIEETEVNLRKNLLKYMQENDLKSSEGPAGKITRKIIHRYKVANPEELPNSYSKLKKALKNISDAKIVEKQFMKQIKESYEIFNEEIPGVEQNVTETVQITWRDEDEESK